MDPYIKELDSRLKSIGAKFAEELGAVRSGRPSVDIIGNLKFSYFDQMVAVNSVGSLSVVPPREVRISLWDKNAVAGVAKAIEDANAGFSVSAEGTTLHATLSALSNERREELMKLVKKLTEGFRIEIRSAREEAIKRIKAAQDKKEMTEDDVADAKEDIQKRVTAANEALETALEKKVKELSE